ncbi:MAG: SAM-dependent chlorinase/fluorinase [Limnothrix sp.]
MNSIALLTDFGIRDGYVGVMKGVIAAIAPTAICIDLSHELAPQDIWGGRFCLMSTAPYFPAQTIFLGVVDPGVGSARQGLAVKFEEGYFVGPDNGLVTGLLDIFGAIAAVRLDNPQYWRVPERDKISNTFHGRDIFAPVAAHLANDIPFEKLGSSVDLDSLVRLEIPTYTKTGDRLAGMIQHIDHFGNLITTIPADCCSTSGGVVMFGDRQAQIPYVKTYSRVPAQTLCALPGSHGWLEISLNQGSAEKYLAARRRDPVVYRP